MAGQPYEIEFMAWDNDTLALAAQIASDMGAARFAAKLRHYRDGRVYADVRAVVYGARQAWKCIDALDDSGFYLGVPKKLKNLGEYVPY